MRQKTSISLSTEVLDQIGTYASDGARSEFIEKALWNYLDWIRRQERDASDIQTINAAASYLNDEALDTLEYQANS